MKWKRHREERRRISALWGSWFAWYPVLTLSGDWIWLEYVLSRFHDEHNPGWPYCCNSIDDIDKRYKPCPSEWEYTQ